MRIARLPANSASQSRNANQPLLPSISLAEDDSVGMGVLDDGTPFMTQRMLAIMCGVMNAHIGYISAQWNEEDTKPRIAKIKKILADRGEIVDSPHMESGYKGRRYFAYSEAVCLAIIEYYAFDAGNQCQPEARDSYRKLTQVGFRTFVYASVGYDPNLNSSDPWRPFHDRVSLSYNSVPAGHFSVFREAAELLVSLVERGVPHNESIIPDISIGQAWSTHWTDSRFDEKFGQRKEYLHYYPDYFPQAASNPQKPWCYPDDALPEFRRWFRQNYVSGGKFAKYLAEKVKKGSIHSEVATVALAAYGQTLQLPARRDS
jgi:hypothetical protein